MTHAGPTLLKLPVLTGGGGGKAPGGAACSTGGTPCEECHGGCCRSFAVPVTGADVFRLTAATGLGFWEVACRWPDGDGRIGRKLAPALHFSDEPGPTVLCLAHHDSETLPGSTRCRFLNETAPDGERPLGLGRCGEYENRPAACRSFPTRFAADGRLTTVHDVPDRGRAGAHPAYDLCPRPWTAGDVDPLEAPAQLAAARWEMDFFRQIAAAWNRAPRPAAALPAYLEAVYRGRVTDGDVRQRRRAA